MTPKRQHTPAAMLNVVGLIVAAAGIMIQYVSGVDYPTIPPGPIILLAAAAVVAFGPWRWSPVAGLVAALFLSLGGAIATIAGNGFGETLGDPGEVGAFAGAMIQIVGLAIALPAGIVAAKLICAHDGSRHERPLRIDAGSPAARVVRGVDAAAKRPLRHPEAGADVRRRHGRRRSGRPARRFDADDGAVSCEREQR